MGLNFPHQAQPTAMPPLGGRYQILEKLGAGGFGQTFLAQDLHLPGHPQCVVKQLKPQVNSAQEMQVARRLFETEANVLSQLGAYPQIPRLLAHFEENEEFYLAQELIEGHLLEAELENARPWSDAQIITFLGDILTTLAFVHNHRVIHRDLKPLNLIRRQDDGRIVLIDFGAVKQVSTQLGSPQTSLNRTISIGTQGYMPLEQLAGNPKFSSDVYSVGMIAIQALTGHHPSTLAAHPDTGELVWQALAPQTHPALIALLDKMVRYDFRARYGNAAEALTALKALPAGLSQFMAAPGHAPAAENASNAQSLQPDTIAPRSPSSAASNPLPPPMTAQTVVAARQASGYQPAGPTMAKPSDNAVRRSHPSQKFVFSKLIFPISIGSVALVVLGALIWKNVISQPTVITEDPLPVLTEEPPVVITEEPPVVVAENSPDATTNRPPVEENVKEDSPPVVTDGESSVAIEEEPPVGIEEESPTGVTDEPESDEPETDEPEIDEPEIDELPSEIAPNTLEAGTAIATITNFYDYISEQNWDTARSMFGPELARQFDPDFFQQFQQVTVENLRITNQTEKTIELLGQNTYVYPNGSTQREERTFTVQIVDNQPRIVDSAFAGILSR